MCKFRKAWLTFEGPAERLEPRDASHGPLQVVVSGEERHSRWVKQVAAIIKSTEVLIEK